MGLGLGLGLEELVGTQPEVRVRGRVGVRVRVRVRVWSGRSLKGQKVVRNGRLRRRLARAPEAMAGRPVGRASSWEC